MTTLRIGLRYCTVHVLVCGRRSVGVQQIEPCTAYQTYIHIHTECHLIE